MYHERMHVLSIGLNQRGERHERVAQLDQTLRMVGATFGPISAVTMTRGEWDGVPERTVQIAVLASAHDIAHRVPHLVIGLRQDCIAVHAVRPSADLPLDGWTLHYAGAVAPGASLAEFPIVVDVEGAPQ